MFRNNNVRYLWTSGKSASPQYQKLKPSQLRIPNPTPFLDEDDAIKSNSVQKKLPSLQAEGTLREHIRFFVDRSFVGRWWDILDALVNLVFVCWYIYLTTFSLGPRDQPHPTPPPMELLHIDTFIAMALFLVWYPKVYLAFDPWRTLFFDFFSHLSLLSTITVFVAHAVRVETDDSLLQVGDLIFLYPFRFWRLHLSLMNNLHPSDKNLLINLKPITRKSVELGLSIFFTLFIVTAWVHICLFRVQKYYDLTFFDVFYTISVSSTSGLATVLFGTIYSNIQIANHSR